MRYIQHLHAMPIPDYQTCFRPVLALAAESPITRASASRKVTPKPPAKPKKKNKRRRYAKPAPTGTYAYEAVPVMVRKKKTTKKR